MEGLGCVHGTAQPGLARKNDRFHGRESGERIICSNKAVGKLGMQQDIATSIAAWPSTLPSLVGKLRYTQDDFPYTTELTLEEGAAGKTDVPALIVMDGITNAEVSQTLSRHEWRRGSA